MYLRQNESIARAAFVILRIASPSPSFFFPLSLPPLSLALPLFLSRDAQIYEDEVRNATFSSYVTMHTYARAFTRFPGARLACEFLQARNRVRVANFHLMLAESNPVQFKCRILDVCLSKLVICKRGFFEHNSWTYFFLLYTRISRFI